MRASAALLAALVCAGAPRAFAQGSGETEASFQSIVVQPGDTLWAIANKFLKDPARWDEIVRHNRLPTKDPTVALPGMTLRVPIRLIKTNLRAAYLVSVVKRVMYRRRETPDWKDGRLRMELFQGDSLRTLEASKARVELMDKELLSLEPNSMAVIKPMDREGDLELHSGSVFAGYARVVTSSARVTPKTQDTRYAASIDSDQTTRVEVYKGAAAVDAQGSRVDVPAGMGTRVMKGLAPEVPKAVPNLPDLDSRFGFPSETKAAEPPPQRSLSLTA
ncbi:MAG: LysM peptidoglycan-binding domain-containing protein, partial [Elusimicrobia bacterium]|nr:LysM peptidoglycan-binding domain-containing protein [Elusimicrobiota bacterium]